MVAYFCLELYRPSPYKLILAFLVLVAFSARTMDGFLIVVDYYTHTAQYAKNCINKDKPYMHCNGKCQMFNKLKTREKEDKDSPQRKSDDKNDITLSSKSYFACAATPVMVLLKKTRIPDLLAAAAIQRASSIFHPPQIPSLIS